MKITLIKYYKIVKIYIFSKQEYKYANLQFQMRVNNLNYIRQK